MYVIKMSLITSQSKRVLEYNITLGSLLSNTLSYTTVIFKNIYTSVYVHQLLEKNELIILS